MSFSLEAGLSCANALRARSINKHTIRSQEVLEGRTLMGCLHDGRMQGESNLPLSWLPSQERRSPRAKLQGRKENRKVKNNFASLRLCVKSFLTPCAWAIISIHVHAKWL